MKDNCFAFIIYLNIFSSLILKESVNNNSPWYGLRDYLVLSYLLFFYHNHPNHILSLSRYYEYILYQNCLLVKFSAWYSMINL